MDRATQTMLADEYYEQVAKPLAAKQKPQFALAAVGLIGSGKSTVLGKIAQHIPMVWISGDELRQYIRHKHLPDQPSGVIIAINTMVVARLRQEGYRMVYDNDLANSKVRSHVLEENQRAYVPVLWVRMVAPESVILRRGAVVLQSYNPVWTQVFEHEKSLLETIFGQAAVAIEHVGSTAVPGLSAKPVIDIEVGLRNLESWIAFVAALNSAGYTYMSDRVKADEIFMPKGSEERRTHHLHITEYDSREWRRSLKFRDMLRTEDRVRNEYAVLKVELARRFPDNRAAYSAAKAAFIERSLAG